MTKWRKFEHEGFVPEDQCVCPKMSIPGGR
jgi:hypothetical protein